MEFRLTQRVTSTPAHQGTGGYYASNGYYPELYLSSILYVIPNEKSGLNPADRYIVVQGSVQPLTFASAVAVAPAGNLFFADGGADNSVYDLIRERVFTKKAELDEERVPLSRIRLNRCPFLAPMSTMSDSAALRLGLDRSECLKHLEVIKKEPELLQKMVAVFERREPPPESDDPELRLYAGSFFPEDDARAFEVVHERLAAEGAASAKPALYRMKYADERPAQMLRRLYARNFPETLSGGEKAKWRAFCAGRLQLPPLPGATDLATFGKVVSQRLENAETPARERGLLHELLAYKTGLEKEVLGYEGK